jgi:hypothetical protein
MTLPLRQDLITPGTSATNSEARISSKPSAYACMIPYSMPLWTILA